MGKYFGTDGFRGEANVKLTVEHAFKVGRYLGWYYGREHKAKIVIGKDTRRSSYMFEYALAAGITASGADAYLLHVTTTPSVSYVVRTEGFDCGIMISASHNPFYDNGIKVINGQGHKLEAEVEEKIEAFPALSETELAALFAQRVGLLGSEAAEFWLGLLPAKLGRALWADAGLPENARALPASAWPKLAATAKCWRFEGLTPCGWKQAQTTGGGLLLDEVEDDFQFKGCPGLYFVGETLDCAGSFGGYNLHWAFGSGIIAGRAAAKLRKKKK